MAQRTVTVASKVGLHARPAAIFAQRAAAAGVPVTIARPGGAPVDAASVLMVMTLGVPHGEDVVLEADGDGAEAALDDLVAVLATDLDSEDAPPPAGAGA
ncbi:HPr family phosphocarrier protein [Cellulomonas carbonis]|uniref:Phosphocarrier protein HPr n=1 Tax=Cellulomonas carbonis T26 TaxID=947969 RepID=A0A0A0BMD4_9CELL|nr:HPr family phosphocarrier protein [Cellulomonas carbonis]KGM09116.1 dihydroxyacetone kinase [Cellulomonas carbonis T26]GGC10426.1 phosphotransferase [Cellulomonas carbonis]